MTFMTRFVLVFFLLFLGTEVGAQERTLKRGDTLRGTLTAGDTIRYLLDTEAEYLVRGSVDQISVDVIVRVLNPDGTAIRTLDGPARGPERFQFETDEEGEYRIEVIPFEDGEGEYSITLELVERVATDPEELADQLLSAYDAEDAPGVVVSVWRDGKTVFSKGYGMADLTWDIPFEVETPSNIGSTSKQFTAFAVMLLVEDGKLSLDDDVRDHIPELPDFGEKVTVRNLLSHTTGYREIFNLMLMAGRRIDHGDWVDRDEFIPVVQRQPALQNSPGSEFNYNNTAFGLAALIVERISEQSFPEFMEERVFGPLAMTETQVRPSREHVIKGRAEGYTPDGDGTFLVLGDLGASTGAGGIYATVGDLQKWVENFSKADVGTPEIFQEMMTRNILTTGDTSGYGLGLFIDEQRGLRRVHHGGADIAHRSQLAYYPEISAGITTQSNRADFDGSITFRLAEAFFGDAMESEEMEEEGTGAAFYAANYDPEDFDEYAGRYALDAAPNFILNFFREDGTFFSQATGQDRAEIVPTSDSTFALQVVEASVTFHRNDDGEVDALTLHQGGDNRATRLAEDAPEEWAPSVEELEAFTGRFFSQELEIFYTVKLEEEELVLEQRRSEAGNLTPGEVDMFNGGGFEVSFERDRNDEVIAFYLSNGRTRDVRFQRVK
jgi:CubicO group peptidase (beta-lactamase class C family)